MLTAQDIEELNKKYPKTTPGFLPAFGRGVTGAIESTGRGLESIGVEGLGGSLRRMGEEGQAAIGQSPIQKPSDIFNIPFTDTLAEAVGSTAPYILSSLAGGAGGAALAGRLVGPAARAAGSLAGAAAPTYASEYGEILGNQERSGQPQNLGEAALGAAGATALDFLGLGAMSKALPKGVRAKLPEGVRKIADVVGKEPEDLTRWGGIKRGVGLGLAGEGVTEGLQSYVEQKAGNLPTDWNDIVVSSILGGLGGGVFGGVGGAFHGGKKKEEEVKPGEEVKPEIEGQRLSLGTLSGIYNERLQDAPDNIKEVITRYLQSDERVANAVLEGKTDLAYKIAFRNLEKEGAGPIVESEFTPREGPNYFVGPQGEILVNPPEIRTIHDLAKVYGIENLNTVTEKELEDELKRTGSDNTVITPDVVQQEIKSKSDVLIKAIGDTKAAKIIADPNEANEKVKNETLLADAVIKAREAYFSSDIVKNRQGFLATILSGVQAKNKAIEDEKNAQQLEEQNLLDKKWEPIRLAELKAKIEEIQAKPVVDEESFDLNSHVASLQAHYVKINEQRSLARQAYLVSQEQQARNADIVRELSKYPHTQPEESTAIDTIGKEKEARISGIKKSYGRALNRLLERSKQKEELAISQQATEDLLSNYRRYQKVLSIEIAKSEANKELNNAAKILEYRKELARIGKELDSRLEAVTPKKKLGAKKIAEQEAVPVQEAAPVQEPVAPKRAPLYQQLTSDLEETEGLDNIYPELAAYNKPKEVIENAKQESEAGPLNGDVSTQPAKSQRVGDTAESGKGVQPERQGKQAVKESKPKKGPKEVKRPPATIPLSEANAQEAAATEVVANKNPPIAPKGKNVFYQSENYEIAKTALKNNPNAVTYEYTAKDLSPKEKLSSATFIVTHEKDSTSPNKYVIKAIIKGEDNIEEIRAKSLNDAETIVKTAVNALRNGQPTLLTGKAGPYSAEKMAGVHATVRYSDMPGIVQGLTSMENGQQVIDIALGAKGSSAEGHEVIHVLENAGVLSAGEVGIIDRAFGKGMPMRGKLEDALTRAAIEQDMDPQTLKNELKDVREARAYGFQMYLDGKFQPVGKLARIFDKLKQFIQRLGSWLRGEGFRNWQDVFDAIERGDYATKAATKTPTQQAPQKSLIGHAKKKFNDQSTGFDGLKEALTVIKEGAQERLFNNKLGFYGTLQLTNSFANQYFPAKLTNLVLSSKAQQSKLVSDAVRKLVSTGESMAKVLSDLLQARKKMSEVLMDASSRKVAKWNRLDEKSPGLAWDVGLLLRAHTYARVDPSLDTPPTSYNADQLEAYKDLRQQYLDLVKRAPEVAEVWKEINGQFQSNYETLRNLVQDIIKDADPKTRKHFQQMFPAKLDCYNPLGRFGDYVLEMVKTDALTQKSKITNEDRHVEFFDNKEDREEVAAQLEKEGYTVYSKTSINDYFSRSENAADAAAIRELDKIVDNYFGEDVNQMSQSDLKMVDEIKSMLREMQLQLIARSYKFTGKQKRKFVPGASLDQMRSVKTKFVSDAYRISALKYNYSIKGVLDTMQWMAKHANTYQYKGESESYLGHELPDDYSDKASRIVGEYKKHIWREVDTDNPVVGFLKNATFLYAMASPAHGLINLQQVPFVGIPRLRAMLGGVDTDASWGEAVNYFKAGWADYSKIFAARRKNAKGGFRPDSTWWDISSGIDALAGKEADPNDLTDMGLGERGMFTYLINKGRIDKTITLDLASRLDMPDNSALSKAGHYFMKYGSIFAHESEVANRAVTSLMTYKAFKDKYTKQGMTEDEAHRQATLRAEESNDFTNLVYDREFKPRYMTGKVLSAITQFRMFEQGMIYNIFHNIKLGWLEDGKHLSKEERMIARRTIAGIFTTYGIFTGAMGLPFAGAILAMLNSLYDWDDDDPKNLRQDITLALGDLVGEKGAMALLHGLPSLTPLPYTAPRAGLDNLFWRESRFDPTTKEGLLAWTADHFAGPALGVTSTVMDGMRQFTNGDVERGLEAMTPKIIKDPLIAARRIWQGTEKDRRGYEQGVDIDLLDTLYQGVLGVAPKSIYQQRETKGYLTDEIKAIQARKKDLKTGYVMAMEERDMDEVRDIQRAIQRFNQKNPKQSISSDDLQAALKSRRHIEDKELYKGVRIPKGYEDVRKKDPYAMLQNFAEGGVVGKDPDFEIEPAPKPKGFVQGNPDYGYGTRYAAPGQMYSPKGLGYYGMIKRPGKQGMSSSELGASMDINGRETEVPTMVPGLTRQELKYLINTPAEQQAKEFRTPIGQAITTKAREHAIKRFSEGKNPFAGYGENTTPLPK